MAEKSDPRWCKTIVVGTEKRTVEIPGGPKETQVLVLSVHAMNPGKSAMDTAFADEADEELTFMAPASTIPILIKNLLLAQRMIDET